MVLGKYALFRREFLKENRRTTYTDLLISDKLNDHLAETEQMALSWMDWVIAQMARTEGVTEELKAHDPMKWMQLMNNLWNTVEETIFTELIYS